MTAATETHVPTSSPNTRTLQACSLCNLVTSTGYATCPRCAGYRWISASAVRTDNVLTITIETDPPKVLRVTLTPTAP